MSNSSIGWIDFSSEHRDKVKTVIGLLSAPGVVDELGIGGIRDAFADFMFPGISTIQTRAKYFTLTALLIRDYMTNERASRRPRSLEKYLEEEEKNCRIQLVERHGEERRGLGIIGGLFKTRRDRDVVRRPSSVYWNGLRAFGFVTPSDLSLAEFGRRLSSERLKLRALLEDSGQERGDDLDAEDGGHQLRVRVPQLDEEDYWENLSIDLTREEAVFLRQKITLHQRESLLGQILGSDSVIAEVLKLPAEADFEELSTLPFIGKLRSEELGRIVQHARDFWRIMKGAHIRYNCLLQASGFGTHELRTKFDGQWEEWRESMARFPSQWDTGFMWALVHRHGGSVREPTRNFVNQWIELARGGSVDLARCNEVVIRQEQLNKGPRARLRPGNQEAVNGWIGFETLQYRWPQVRRIIADIHHGESGKEAGGA
jgi:hypothetical protein